MTYGDLTLLNADLLAVGPKAAREAARPALAAPARARRRGVLASLPMVLRVLWTIWLHTRGAAPR